MSRRCVRTVLEPERCTGEEVLVLGGHATAEAAADTGRKQTDDVVLIFVFRPHGHLVEFFHGEATVRELLLAVPRSSRGAYVPSSTGLGS